MKTIRASAVIPVLIGMFIFCQAGPIQAQPDHGRGFMGHSTEEQQEAIHNTISKLREQGAGREEIHEAVAELLREFGVEPPQNLRTGRPGGRRFGHGPDSPWAQLTDEQREAIHKVITEMREQGADPEEIRSTVRTQMKEYGIDLPVDREKRHPRGRHGPGGRFWKNLTDEQRSVLQEKIHELRTQGATRREIHAALAEMLQGYGLEPSRKFEHRSSGAASVDNTGGLLSETAPAGDKIQAVNYPNPFNPDTHIFYTLHDPDEVRIDIYNITGQLIRSFDLGFHTAGSYNVYWDGHDKNGAQVSSGIYLYRIEAGPYSVINRMMLLK